MANSRIFYITVLPIIFHTTTSRSYNNIQVDKGIYYYSNKFFSKQPWQGLEKIYAEQLHKQILNLTRQTCNKLIDFWFRRVNRYFNRRAYGMYNRGFVATHRSAIPYSITKRQNPATKKLSARSITTRQHTGQLRRCLKVGNISVLRAELYCTRTYARTDGRDYIEILMHGAKPGPRRYIPELDCRPRDKNMSQVFRGRTTSYRNKRHVRQKTLPFKKFHTKWGGISRNYWSVWQGVFQTEILREEKLLNSRISKLVEEMDIKHAKDMRSSMQLNIRNPQVAKDAAEFERVINLEYGGKKSKYITQRQQVAPYYKEDISKGKDISRGQWAQLKAAKNKNNSIMPKRNYS